MSLHSPGNARPIGVSTDSVSEAIYGGDDRRYRYRLSRIWDATRRPVFWLMMNPSIATEQVNDRTVARCEAFTRLWGHGGILVGNTFAYRATDQSRLLEVDDPVGPDNDRHLLQMAAQAALTIVAYGTPHPSLVGRGLAVEAMLIAAGHRLHALGLSKAGRPRHPLYLGGHLLPFAYPVGP